MRMWMVNPRLLCRRHLLGEHVELHMLVGHLQRGRSIQGFLASGLLQPQDLTSRHDDLVEEMTTRGYQHSSPLGNFPVPPKGTVDIGRSLTELHQRCPDCKKRFQEEMKDQDDL